MRATRWMFIFTCLGMSAAALAQSQRGDWQLTLALTGNSDRDLNNNAVGFAGSLGYYVTDNLSLSVRQTFAWSNLGGSSATVGTTQGAIDWNFHFGDRNQWQPFIGGNVGYFYGDLPGDHFEAAPEVGLEYYLNQTTFLYLIGEYQFFFGPNSAASDQQIVYRAGIGLRF